MTAVCTRKDGGQLHAVDLPADVVKRLRRPLPAVRHPLSSPRRSGDDMRISRAIPLFAVLSATLVQAQSGTLRGVEAGDVNRSVDACSDFYEFANGKWRAENPIPAAMPRWSRRWAAGEAAKDRLHEILDQVSTLAGQPKGSIEQLIGDFYGACMDEAAINSLGAKPVMPLLAEIDQLRDVASVQRMIGRLHAIGIRVPFQLVGGSDNHKPTDVIAQIYAGGLGMPDRDYYVKTEPASRRRGRSTSPTWPRSSGWPGKPMPRRWPTAVRSDGDEDRESVARQCRVARSRQPTTRCRLPICSGSRPRSTGPRTTSAGLAPAAVNVAEPRFLQAFSRHLPQNRSRTGRST